MTIHVRLTSSGEISLPLELRARLGLADGGSMVLEETEDGLILRTVTQAVDHARALARQYTADDPEATVDAFLKRRHCESGQ